jgi:hypothetical protein
MVSKLKRDQIPTEKATNWKNNFNEESKHTFNLDLPKIILQKETYKTLIGDNENRVRIYFGLETDKKDGKYQLCAFAVSAFLLGSGDVYADYETPVYKLEEVNIDVSDKVKTVIESIRLYRQWRSGELDEDHSGAQYRQYIYPNAFLLTKFELHELFNVQNSKEIKFELGIAKTMTAMVSPYKSPTSDVMLKSATTGEDEEEQGPFDFIEPCPPNCDERSVFNPS